jgi:polyhydroxybutyrate depolymerase
MNMMKLFPFISFSGLMACFQSDVPTITLTHDGIEREYLLDLPDSYDGSVKLPLVLNFHGGCMDAASQRTEMDMRELSNQHNFILAYPQGTSEDGSSWGCKIWNSGPFASQNQNANKATANDLGFVEALIDELSTTYSVDQDRIYATGFSNGGFFAYALGCYSDRIAAIAPVAALMTDEAMAQSSNATNPCTLSHPMPVIHLHGTADSAVPFDAGEAAVSFMRERNHTGEVSVISLADETSGNIVERHSSIGGDRGSAVELYKIYGGEHETFDDLRVEGMNSSQLIWDFVSQYDIHGLLSSP